MKNCVLEVQDQVNIKFLGLDPVTRRKLVESVRFFLHSARHTMAFKLGRWDGYVSFCSIAGQSQLHLLDILLPIVTNNGYEIDIDDKRTVFPSDFVFDTIDKNFLADKGYVWPKNHPKQNEPMILNDHQVDAVNIYLEEKQAIQEISTGGGKTIITGILSMILEPYGKTIVIVPSKSLVKQTHSDYQNLKLNSGVLFGDEKNLLAHHTICTWQSLESMKKLDKQNKTSIFKDWARDIVCVIVDEAHGAKGSVLRDLLLAEFSHCPIRFGLTGTIPKEKHDYFALLSTVGPVKNQIKAKDLQEKGILSKCHVTITQTVEYGEFRDYQEEKKHIVNYNMRNEWLAEQLLEISKTGNTFVLVENVEQGNQLVEYMNIPTPYIYAGVKVDKRKQYYDEMNASTNMIIVASYGCASTGININRIFNLVLIEPGKSFIRVIQSVGRGLRIAEDKDFVQIYDFCSTLKYSKKHLTERKKFYKDAGYEYELKKVER